MSVIPSEVLHKIPRIIEYLKRLDEHMLPRCDGLDLYLMCLNNEAVLWGVFADDLTPVTVNNALAGVVVTKATLYPKGTMLTITALTGDRLDDWMDLAYSTLTRSWKESGFLGLEEWGRDGWIRKLKKYGFQKSHILMEDFDGQGLLSAERDDLNSHTD